MLLANDMSDFTQHWSDFPTTIDKSTLLAMSFSHIDLRFHDFNVLVLTTYRGFDVAIGYNPGRWTTTNSGAARNLALMLLLLLHHTT